MAVDRSARRTRLSPERVEELKKQEKFDRQLAVALIPPTHDARRRWVKHPVYGETVANAIKDHIDPKLRVFISKGCRRIPGDVYNTRVVHSRQKIGGPELRRLVKGFLEVCLPERGNVDRAQMRQAIRNTENLILEMVRRNKNLMKKLFGA
jgi:hypothetical protein